VTAKRRPPSRNELAPRFLLELVSDDTAEGPITLRREGAALAVLIPAARYESVVGRLPDAIKALCR
jgi:hypothetical protein